VGRLVPWKRIDELIKVIEEIENTRLTVVGEGPCREYLLKLVESLNLQTRVRFLGKLPQQQVIKYIISCDVFVLNSEYEGLPHTLLEAMACGVPVIATRIGGIPEIIKHKENGILINKNDLQELKKSIFLLKERKDLCKKLVANAKKCIKEKFSYAKMIEDTLKVFDLLKGK
jgi:glycosyltransferase involved in cell wall biosynthesis